MDGGREAKLLAASFFLSHADDDVDDDMLYSWYRSTMFRGSLHPNIILRGYLWKKRNPKLGFIMAREIFFSSSLYYFVWKQLRERVSFSHSHFFPVLRTLQSMSVCRAGLINIITAHKKEERKSERRNESSPLSQHLSLFFTFSPEKRLSLRFLKSFSIQHFKGDVGTTNIFWKEKTRAPVSIFFLTFYMDTHVLEGVVFFVKWSFPYSCVEQPQEKESGPLPNTCFTPSHKFTITSTRNIK